MSGPGSMIDAELAQQSNDLADLVDAVMDLRERTTRAEAAIYDLQHPTTPPPPPPTPRHPLEANAAFETLPDAALTHYADALNVHDQGNSYPDWVASAASGDSYDVGRHLSHHVTALMVALAATRSPAFVVRLTEVGRAFLAGLHPSGAHGVPYRHHYRVKGGGGGVWHEMDSILSAKVAAVIAATLNKNRAVEGAGMTADALTHWLKNEWAAMWTAARSRLPFAYLAHPARALVILHRELGNASEAESWLSTLNNEARHTQNTTLGVGAHYDLGLNNSSVPNEPMSAEYGSLLLNSIIEDALLLEDDGEVTLAARSVLDAVLDDVTWASFGYDWVTSTDAGARWNRNKYEIMSYHLLSYWFPGSSFGAAAASLRAARGASPRVLGVSVGLLADAVRVA